MSSEPDPAPLGVDKASDAITAQGIVKLICAGQITWDDLVSLHTVSPIPRRVVLVELRTPEEKELAAQLEKYLADNYGEEESFDDIRHTIVTHLVDRTPPPSLCAKAEKIGARE